MRKHLQKQNRFAEALLLVQVESMFCKDNLFQFWYEWISSAEQQLVKTSSVNLPLLMRVIETRLELAKLLAIEGSSSAAEIEVANAVEELEVARAAVRFADAAHDLTTTFPRFDLQLDITRRAILDSKLPSSIRVTVNAHIALADRACAMRDKRVERRCMLAAIEQSRQNVRQSDQSEMSAEMRALHIQLVRQRVHIESRDSGEALYLGHALNQLGILTVSDSQTQGAEYLRLVHMFFDQYRFFDVPDNTFILASIAIQAAQIVGDVDDMQKYQRMKIDAATKCSSQQRIDPELSVYLDNDDFFRNFEPEHRPDFWKTFQRNISVLIVVWVAQEIESKLLTYQEAATLLTIIPTVEMPVLHSKGSILKAAQILQERIFAFPKPTEDSLWDSWLMSIQAWLERKDLTRSEPIRQALLVKIQACRTSHFENYLNGLPAVELQRVLPRAFTEHGRHVDVLESMGTLRHNFKHCLDHVASLDNITDAKFRLVNCYLYQVLKQQQCTKDQGLVSDSMLHDMFVKAHECYDYYKREGRTERLVRISHLSAQCCWNRHLLFDSIPITDTFPFFKDAERAYRQLRMENFVLKSSRAFVARDNLADYLQMDTYTALAVTCSLRALLQRLTGATRGLAEDFTLALLAHNFTWWVQRSKAQALTDMLGLDAQLPRSVLPDEYHHPHAVQLLQRETQELMSLESASIAERVTILHEIENLHEEMRREPSLLQILNIREGFSSNEQDLREISSDLASDVVLVDWVYILLLDEWDLAVVTYRNGVVSGIRSLSVKLGDVRKWTAEQLQSKHPLNHRFADRFLHTLDGLVAPLAELTKPNETLVFCPTKDLHQVPLHALKINGQITIERNPIVYCQSLSVLRLCQMSVQNALQHPTDTLKSSIFTPVRNIPKLEENLSKIASTLQASLTAPTQYPKQSFLDILPSSTLVHFHGHSELSPKTPLNQHLDFTGYGLEEDEKEPDDMLTANEIFDLRLKRPSLVTIMGCSSGRAKISNCDNLLGPVTAFHYAGASSVVSALWPISSSDGLAFSRVFYSRLMAEMSSSTGSRTVNLALSMQAAVLALRKPDGTKSRPPYIGRG